MTGQGWRRKGSRGFTAAGLYRTRLLHQAAFTTSIDEERDKWMHSQKKKGKTHGEIRNERSDSHPGWDQLATDQAVGSAIRGATSAYNPPCFVTQATYYCRSRVAAKKE
ncbi:hypothetical protein Pr1d_32990 [Bythopirellula goksoeyrii]|uniref:Uncharacterized protein n=2 Tax=Bythopirellula goksoeyrii TaxID=1400387 RepID=A0A5B9QED2_9BACT|nr:hypothetical protein Pr1d_32990 [Bythopirellula goksoeyrii]